MTIQSNSLASKSNWKPAAFILPLTALTLFLSAFLLFSVQPFFAKMVLPRLGGAPAVWSVAMVFFQTALLAGYGYAHVLTRYLPLKSAVLVHLCVLVLALVALPISIPENWQHPPADGQALWLIGLFTVSVGLPFFAVSANGPLLQAWFSRTGHPHAQDPYFLYGASNIGSFASLILYIVLIEPLFDLGAQSRLWSGGFILLGLMIAACGLAATALSNKQVTAPVPQSAASQTHAGLAQWAVWIALAFIPSALLVAVTAHVSTDIAAAPLLWIVPLALFLLTFVIVFQQRPIVPHPLMKRLMPVLVLPLLVLTLSSLIIPMSVGLVLHFATFFVVAMTAHGELAARRPAARHLTEFYFAMSIGGVLGGIFSSLVAMSLFSWIAEYPLLLMASLFVLPALREKAPARQILKGAALAALVLAVLALLPKLGLYDAYVNAGSNTAANLLFAAAAAYFLWREPKLVPSLAMVLVANAFVFKDFHSQSLSVRSFFGVVRVENDTVRGVRKFQHGTTLHGAMRLKDADAGVARPKPLTYYTTDGGLNLALQAARANAGGRLALTGIVGVGAGSLACQMQPGEAMDLVEIDPLVMKIANDPAQFRFLPACGQSGKQIIGDGRLVLQDMADARYDALVIDVFSSDSIPVHMMTTEAISMFMAKVKPGGLLIIHVSNNHMELESVVAANAKALGLEALVGFFTPENNAETAGLAQASRVAVLARNTEDFGALLADARWHGPVNKGAKAWTDGYSNVLAAILRN